MATDISDLGSKVEDGGKTPSGKLTATEFNTLVRAVQENQNSVKTISYNSGVKLKPDENGNVVAEGGVFCSAEEADKAGRAMDAQKELRHKLKANEKAKKAAKSSDNLSIFLTSEKVNGDELVQLAVVDQNTGKEVKTFRLSDDKNVVYEIDFNSNTVYAVDGGKLKAIKY